MNEATKAPAYPSETPELWAALRQAAEKDDTPAVQTELETMDLSRRLAPLMIAAVSEEIELSAIVAAGTGMAEKLRSIEEQWCFLNATPPPAKIEKMRELAEQRKQLADERLQAQRAIAAAEVARRCREWLRFWLAELFGLPALDHGGCLSSLQPSPKVFDVMVNLKIGGAVYSVAPNNWRIVGQDSDVERPKRRYTSFSPLAPRH